MEGKPRLLQQARGVWEANQDEALQHLLSQEMELQEGKRLIVSGIQRGRKVPNLAVDRSLQSGIS